MFLLGHRLIINHKSFGRIDGALLNGLAYIIVSKVEAQSIAALQALSCGLPVIAARAGALPELVRQARNGYLAPPDDIQKTCQKYELLYRRLSGNKIDK